MRIPGVEVTRFEPHGAAEGTAVVLPGRAYPPVAPLLWLATQVLLAHRWRVTHVWWDAPGEHGDADHEDWVADQLLQHLPDSGRVLVVGKSLGTLAAPVAAQRGYDAIWLTPLLQEQPVVDALAANAARQLLVGGTADHHAWRSDVARQLGEQGCDVLEVAEADHAMQAAGDPVRSAEILVEVTRAMDSFLG
ncbi:MAG: hypothetical protein QM747_20765 [Nocardioides sp.]